MALGSWWAYTELGWGGWWFWDPVENAAFVPWLVGTALIHALAVSDRRGLFNGWTVLLAILGFSLSLLGTFLVRSGVLSSVHAFAIDPKRGIFILSFLLLVIGGSLLLFALRAPRLAGRGRFDLLSRETLLLANTMLLTVAAATVLFGTLYPLLLDVAGLGKISVGAPYFDIVFVPLMAPVVFLMGLGPLARWQHAPLPGLWTRLRWALVLAALLGLALPLVWGGWSPLTALGLFLAVWLLLSTAAAVQNRLRDGAATTVGWWGMLAAHLGVDLARDGRFVRKLHPEKRRYSAMPAMQMTEAAIASGVLGDIYVALGDEAGQGAWTLRVYHKPFVTWIWGGCAFMVLGGLLALCDRRYRIGRQSQTRGAG